MGSRVKERWNQRGVRKGYYQAEDVAFVVGRGVHMLRKTETGEKRKKRVVRYLWDCQDEC